VSGIGPALNGLEGFTVNPDWMSLPLFDRGGWRRLSFGAFADSVNERVDPGDAADEVYVGLDDLDSLSLRIRRWGKGSDVIGTKLRFQKGDIIFGRRRAYQRKLAIAEMDGICSAHAMVVRAKPDVVLPGFLPFLMMSDSFMKRAVEISVGSLSPTVNWTTLRDQKFDLPPVEQQRRIADTLWSIHAALASAEMVTRRAEEYRECLVNELFSEDAAETTTLLELCGEGGIRIGPFGSQLHAREYVDEGVPVVMPTNLGSDEIVANGIRCITTGKANELSMHRLRSGDVLLPRRGDLTKLGFVGVVQDGWICGTGTIRIRLPQARARRLLFYALSRESVKRWLERHAVGTTMPNLNSSIVGKIQVSWPKNPEAAEESISAADSMLAELANHSAATGNLLVLAIGRMCDMSK
jgi:hypothetical protein